jgi:hypothetical protein
MLKLAGNRLGGTLEAFAANISAQNSMFHVNVGDSPSSACRCPTTSSTRASPLHLSCASTCPAAPPVLHLHLLLAFPAPQMSYNQLEGGVPQALSKLAVFSTTAHFMTAAGNGLVALPRILALSFNR